MAFKSVQKTIAKNDGVPMQNAGAILASASRKASPAAKAKNPKLLKVTGAKPKGAVPAKKAKAKKAVAKPAGGRIAQAMGASSSMGGYQGSDANC